MEVSGKSGDLYVVNGVQALVGTHGVPLGDVLFAIKSRGLVVDWIDYIQDCLQEGHKSRSIRVKIMNAVLEVYGKGYAIEFEKLLNTAFPE